MCTWRAADPHGSAFCYSSGPLSPAIPPAGTAPVCASQPLGPGLSGREEGGIQDGGKLGDGMAQARRGRAGAKMGRPTAYTPEACDQIRDFMKDGYSVAAFAGKIGVSRSTVYKWADEHPDFSDALKEAQAISALWWEERARDLALTGEGNATMIVFGLKNRVADEWRDKQAVDHTSSDGSMTPGPSTIIIEAADDDDGDDQTSPQAGEAIQ